MFFSTSLLLSHTVWNYHYSMTYSDRRCTCPSAAAPRRLHADDPIRSTENRPRPTRWKRICSHFLPRRKRNSPFVASSQSYRFNIITRDGRPPPPTTVGRIFTFYSSQRRAQSFMKIIDRGKSGQFHQFHHYLQLKIQS